MVVLSQKPKYCIQSTLHATYFLFFFVKMILFFRKIPLVFDKSFLTCPSDTRRLRGFPPSKGTVFYSYSNTGLFKPLVRSKDFVKLYAKSHLIYLPFLESCFLLSFEILQAPLFFFLCPEKIFCKNKKSLTISIII